MQAGETGNSAPGRSRGAIAAVLLVFLISASTAPAKQVVDYFGTDPAKVFGSLGGEFRQPRGVAVNQSGAGPADAGDIYVVEAIGINSTLRDFSQNRVQRFHRDDNGTPADPYDDEYEFISAWGADVVQPGGGGDKGDAQDADYEICTVASECKAGVAAGGNGTAAGNGALSRPLGIAVDQDTGNVYVADTGNARVNVYTGDGIFLRSFGWDVVASGPGKVAAPSEKQQVTVKAEGGKFSLSFRGETTGATGTGRLNLKNITEVKTTSGVFEIGQVFQALLSSQTMYPLGTTVTGTTSGILTVSSAPPFPSGNPNSPLFGEDLPFSISATELEAELNALPTIGGVGGSVEVSGGPGDPTGSTSYMIEFGGTLAGDDVPALEPRSYGLLLGSGEGEATVETPITGGAYEVCVATNGDVCQAGNYGSGVGQNKTLSAGLLGQTIAVSQPDGNPASGSVFWADPDNRRVNTFSLDGSSPSSFGSSAQFGAEGPRAVAVDSRGVVYAADLQNDGEVERYDFENTNGGGVDFLEPIPTGTNEKQLVKVDAKAGTFNLTFNGEKTIDLPFNAWPNRNYTPGIPGTIGVQEALEALPSIGIGNVEVAGEPSSYNVNFSGALSVKDVPQLIVASGNPPLSGGAGASVATTAVGKWGLAPASGSLALALAVDPDDDDGGPDADVLYALRPDVIQQLGPVNAPGLEASPQDDDARHSISDNSPGGLAIDESSGHIYVSDQGGAGQVGHGVYVLHDSGGPPVATLDSVTDITPSSAKVNATVNPNGGPPVSYRLEYSTDGLKWTALAETLLGTQTTPQAIEAPLDPPGSGLDPGTDYQVRLIATKRFTAPVVTAAASFTTLADAPAVETVGAPLRTATTAQLAGRVNPRGAATDFWFEYGTAPCDVNPCTQTASQPAGAGNRIQLVGARLSGLEPETTYHYRVLADNGNPGSPAAGEDRTFTTRASGATLSNGPFPGPPGSDRAWEQVSMDEANGNPVVANISNGFSGDGNRAIYGMGGGNPLSDTGAVFSQYFAERTASGWQTRTINPPRKELAGTLWQPLVGAEDLSELYGVNHSLIAGAPLAIFNVSPDHPPTKLYEAALTENGDAYLVSADGSRALLRLLGAPDPEFPAASAANFYDVTTGAPQLATVLPDGAPSACALGATGAKNGPPHRYRHWLSPDGDLLFFVSEGPDCADTERLYMRDFAAGVTKLVSGPPLSGQECDAAFLKWTPNGAFLYTASRLAPEDSTPQNCDAVDGVDSDIYRYDVDEGSFSCATCVVAGLDADVRSEKITAGAAFKDGIAVAPDGSRVYFRSPHPLLPGAAPDGAYRVEVDSGDLAYVGELGILGERSDIGQAINADGSVLVFYSKSPFLNPLGEGQSNGGTRQYYRYDDRDRSLVCISCPVDGAAPEREAPDRLDVATSFDPGGPNINFVSAAGAAVFRTTEALTAADQNTPGPGEDPVAGMDIYEWRDGRPLLVTDGLSSWPAANQTPELLGMTPSGKDVFFIAAAQLTPDALDGYYRLYDARVGGGFEFPPPPPPCPLEVCQGTPKGAPEEPAPGSGSFRGAGNATPVPTTRPRCRKGKVRRKGRCVAKRKPPSRKANRNRRSGR